MQRKMMAMKKTRQPPPPRSISLASLVSHFQIQRLQTKISIEINVPPNCNSITTRLPLVQKYVYGHNANAVGNWKQALVLQHILCCISTDHTSHFLVLN